VYFVSFGAIK